MKTCFIIDPIDRLKPYKDTSLDLMVEAMRRGIAVDFCEAGDISILEGRVICAARSALPIGEVPAKTADFFDAIGYGERREVEADGYDAVFIRKDPPFDSLYLSLTLMLDSLDPKVRVVNSPTGVRTVSEKLATLHFARYAPITLASFDKVAIRSFAGRFEQVVLKASYFGSGTGVFISAADKPDFDPILDEILALEPRGPVIAQQFLPEVIEGDTRVMMLNGEAVAALGRKPQEGEFRANIAAGGTEFFHEMTAEQRRIAAEVGPYLKANGIIFAGIDFIGSKLIEMNVTSPTLIQELRKVSDIDMSKRIWDAIGG